MGKNSVQDIARHIADKHGLRRSQAEKFVVTLFDVVSDGLRDEKMVKIKSLGTFKVVEVKDRESVDIHTGERILIEGRSKISFTPDTVMKELVNKPFSQFDTVVLNDGVDFSELDARLEEEQRKEVKIGEPEPVAEEDKGRSTEISAVFDVPEPRKDTNEDGETGQPQEEGLPESPLKEESKPSEPVSPLVDFDVRDTETDDEDEPNPEDSEEEAETPVGNTEEVRGEEGTPDEETDTEDAPKSEASSQAEIVEEEEKERLYEEVKANSETEDSGQQEEEQSADAESDAESQAQEEGKENTDLQETDMDETKSNGMYWLMAILAVTFIAFGVGYYLGSTKAPKKTLPEDAAEMYEGHQHLVVDDSLQRQDSLQMVQEERIKAKVDSVTRVNEARKDSVRKAQEKAAEEARLAAEKKEAERLAAQKKAEEERKAEEQRKAAEKARKDASKQTAQTAPPASTSEVLRKAQRKMAYGAYNIVGTDRTITVKNGQTIKGIARFYFGPDMECYIQMHNGVAEVKEGMKLKIPKLKLKKRKK